MAEVDVMRVYEFAKQHNLTSKQALELLAKEGCELKSHTSAIPDELLVKIEKQLLQKKETPPKQEPKEETVTKDTTASIQIKKTAAVLDFHEEQKGQIQQKPTISAPLKNNSNFKQQSSKRYTAPAGEHKKKDSPREQVFEIKPLELQSLTVDAFAAHLRKPVSEIIVALLKNGQVCTKNYLLSVEQVEKLAKTYELEVVRPIAKKTTSELVHNYANATSDKVDKNSVTRRPVVVVMGHVDHGKTSLLDYIRKTRVAAREKGGITQHLGAYEVQTGHGGIVFLDTPGHEAFSKIRQRGASVADIAILVVAVDDGVMPQTVECIKAIQAMKLSIVVAINKIDKVDIAKDPTRLDTIKRQLSQYDILPEEWGGQVIFALISAKTGQGVDNLLEMVALQSELLELTTLPTATAQGYVLESRVERGRGPVATILCRQGELSVGDFVNAGKVWGKIASLVDSSGVQQKSIGASVPVIVSGFEELPLVGEFFRVTTEEEYRKERGAKHRMGIARGATDIAKEAIPVIIKADTNSSLEAVIDGIDKISKKGDKSFFVVHAAVGFVTDNDVIMAETTNALVVGFHTKVESAATQYARNAGVTLLSFDIIYKLFEDFEERVKKEKVVEKKEVKIGEAVVLKTFDIKKIGVIAGCFIREGRFSGEGHVIIKRGRKQIGEGKVKSLQRDKKVVKEVHTGFECAFLVEGFNEWEADDVVECYLKV